MFNVRVKLHGCIWCVKSKCVHTLDKKVFITLQGNIMSHIKRRIVKPMGRVLVASTLATILLALATSPVVAAIIDVNSLADNEVAGNGLCTLREAILSANADADLSSGDCLAGLGDDAIVFSTGPGTIELDSGLPFVKTDMSINGPVAGNMVVRGPLGATNFWVTGLDSAILILDRIDLWVPIAGSSLCVRVDGTETLEFYRGNLYCAAGIRAGSTSTLVVDSSTIYGSRPINIFNTGLLDGTTSVTLKNSSVEGTFWPAIGVDASGDGEVIVNVRDSTLTGANGIGVFAIDESTVFVDIADSIFKDTNTGLDIGAVGEGGGDSTVHAKVERTTFSNNGKGILTRGTSGTIFVVLNESIIVGSDIGIIHGNTPGHLFVTNSTISGNDIGVENGDDVFANVGHTTITNNEIGIFGLESAYVNINRTILAGNDIDCAGGAPSSTGYNVVGVNCGISASTADIIGTAGSPVDPGLWGLTSSGGPTRVHRLRADSPAVDRTSLATCFIGTDQRGFPRPVGNGCDAGSYELEDLTPPEITVPGLITKEATGPRGAIVTYVVTATDNLDPDPDLFCLPSSGSLFPIGTTTVFCTATDLLGNVAQADFDVTVQDTTPPEITVPGLITKEATGPGGAITTYVVTATDIVDPDPDLSCSPSSGSLFPIGTTTVFCAATDLLGNAAQADFDVTVQDTTPPSLILIGAAEIEVIEGNSYDDPGANASDIVDVDLTTEIAVTNPVDTSVPDIYTVSYDVTDNAGNAADTLTRTVTVISQAAAAEDLVETVESLGLPKSVSRSLIKLMTNVARYLDDDDEANDADAQDLINNFIKQVQKDLNKGRLTQAQADLLIDNAEELLSALGG